MQVVASLQNLYQFITIELLIDDESTKNIGERLAYLQHNKERLLFAEAVELPAANDAAFFRQLKRLQTTLETRETLFDVPKGLEARRRISFFANSLFMTMPRAPTVPF